MHHVTQHQLLAQHCCAKNCSVWHHLNKTTMAATNPFTVKGDVPENRICEVVGFGEVFSKAIVKRVSHLRKIIYFLVAFSGWDIDTVLEGWHDGTVFPNALQNPIISQIQFLRCYHFYSTLWQVYKFSQYHGWDLFCLVTNNNLFKDCPQSARIWRHV